MTVDPPQQGQASKGWSRDLHDAKNARRDDHAVRVPIALVDQNRAVGPRSKVTSVDGLGACRLPIGAVVEAEDGYGDGEVDCAIVPLSARRRPLDRWGCRSSVYPGPAPRSLDDPLERTFNHPVALTCARFQAGAIDDGYPAPVVPDEAGCLKDAC
jgi:hypothetical protein